MEEKHPEIPAPGFVAAQRHAQHAAQAPKAGRRPKQRLFRRPPFSFLSAALVVRHQAKGQKVQRGQRRDSKNQHRRLHRSPHTPFGRDPIRGGAGQGSGGRVSSRHSLFFRPCRMGRIRAMDSVIPWVIFWLPPARGKPSLKIIIADQASSVNRAWTFFEMEHTKNLPLAGSKAGAADG